MLERQLEVFLQVVVEEDKIQIKILEMVVLVEQVVEETQQIMQTVVVLQTLVVVAEQVMDHQVMYQLQVKLVSYQLLIMVVLVDQVLS